MASRVLLVEDDPVTRRVYESVIARAGFDVAVSDSAEAALKVLATTPDIDIVVTDWKLPGRDGLELCRAIRRLDGDDHRYVILITGAVGTVEPHLALEAGADEVIGKPISAADLTARVRGAARVAERGREGAVAPYDALKAAVLDGEGELVVRGTTLSARIYLRDGEVAWVHVAGRPSSLRDVFGHDAVGADEARGILAESRSSGRAFDQVIADWGLLTKETVRIRLAAYLSAGLAQVVSQKRAVAVFLPGSRGPSTTQSFPLDELVEPTSVRPALRVKMTAPPPPPSPAAPCLDGSLQCDGCGANVAASLTSLGEFQGVQGVAVVHGPSGEPIGAHGDVIPELMRVALLHVARAVPAGDQVQEILVSGERHLYVMSRTRCDLARVIASVDRELIPLGEARFRIETVARSIAPAPDAPGAPNTASRA